MSFAVVELAPRPFFKIASRDPKSPPAPPPAFELVWPFLFEKQSMIITILLGQWPDIQKLQPGDQRIHPERAGSEGRIFWRHVCAGDQT